MTDPRLVTALLIAFVAVVGILALMLYPSVEEPEQGRVLLPLRVEDAEAGFTNTTAFQVDEEYERIGLSYNITEAAHVRAALTDPQGTRHEADAIPVPEGPDRLELDVQDPQTGTWEFTVWTLNETDRQGYILTGEFFILGFAGETSPSTGAMAIIPLKTI